jgi:hypothetical protein
LVCSFAFQTVYVLQTVIGSMTAATRHVSLVAFLTSSEKA